MLARFAQIYMHVVATSCWLLIGVASGVCQVKAPTEHPNDLHMPAAPSASVADSLHLWHIISEEISRTPGGSDSPSRFFMNTLQQSRQIGFHTGISVSALILAQGYLRQSIYQKSIEMNLLAARYAPQSNYGYSILSTAYHNIANAYASLEKPYYAAYYYYRTANILNTFRNGERIEYIYCNLSNTLPSKFAVYYLEKAEAIARTKENDSLLCMTLLNKAAKWQEASPDDDVPLSYLEEALTISRRLSHNLFEYRSLVRLGAFYLAKENTTKALDFMRQAEQLRPEGDRDASHRNRDMQLLGVVYFQHKEYDRAAQYFQEALRTAENMKLHSQMAGIYNYLAEITQMQGAYERAFNYQKKYSHLKDSFMNESVAANIQDLEIKYRTAEKDREIARKEQAIEHRNILIGGIAGGGLLLFTGACFYYRHIRQKQKMIRQEQELLQLKALMDGEEVERSRIARELHDGIMVNFSSVKMNLGAIMKQYAGTNQTQALQDVVAQLDDATVELRKSAHNLMPDMLLREGLIAAVRYFCSSITRNDGFEIEFNHYGSPPVLPPDAELMLYRIVQELLQNALKYAEASHIIVQIDNTGDLITITVEDNGRGFNADTLSNCHGSGLRSIRSRLNTLGGVLLIETGAEKGTTIYIEIETLSLHSYKTVVHAHHRSYRG